MVTKNVTEVTIAPPNMQVAQFRIRGTSPYVQNKFSEKAKQEMHDKQAKGQQAKKGKARAAKDFQECYENAKYKSPDGWHGIPANCFRAAMISACRMVGFAMTRGKLALFVEPDGMDVDGATALVRFKKGEPEYFEAPCRNETGVADLRARPLWPPGWEMDLRVKFDADQFSLSDVTNLLMRAGMQGGVGEGRWDSKKSYVGMGWGCFEIVKENKNAKAKATS